METVQTYTLDDMRDVTSEIGRLRKEKKEREKPKIFIAGTPNGDINQNERIFQVGKDIVSILDELCIPYCAQSDEGDIDKESLKVNMYDSEEYARLFTSRDAWLREIGASEGAYYRKKDGRIYRSIEPDLYLRGDRREWTQGASVPVVAGADSVILIGGNERDAIEIGRINNTQNWEEKMKIMYSEYQINRRRPRFESSVISYKQRLNAKELTLEEYSIKMLNWQSGEPLELYLPGPQPDESLFSIFRPDSKKMPIVGISGTGGLVDDMFSGKRGDISVDCFEETSGGAVTRVLLSLYQILSQDRQNIIMNRFLKEVFTDYMARFVEDGKSGEESMSIRGKIYDLIQEYPNIQEQLEYMFGQAIDFPFIKISSKSIQVTKNNDNTLSLQAKGVNEKGEKFQFCDNISQRTENFNGERAWRKIEKDLQTSKVKKKKSK